jgi:hypothetical protein
MFMPAWVGVVGASLCDRQDARSPRQTAGRRHTGNLMREGKRRANLADDLALPFVNRKCLAMH